MITIEPDVTNTVYIRLPEPICPAPDYLFRMVHTLSGKTKTFYAPFTYYCSTGDYASFSIANTLTTLSPAQTEDLSAGLVDLVDGSWTYEVYEMNSSPLSYDPADALQVADRGKCNVNESEIEALPTYVKDPVVIPSYKRTPPPNTITITFADISGSPVADPTSVSEWNTFFDLPTNGTPFTSASLNGNIVTLTGGSNITIAPLLFSGSNITRFVDIGSLFQIMTSAFAYCTSLEYASSTTCRSISTDDEAAFAYCTSLAYAGFPACTFLGYYAFANCTSLNNPVLTSVQTMRAYCFNGCGVGLTAVSLPSLSTIGNGAFQSCTRLASIYMPVLTQLGGSVGNDGVFQNLTEQEVTITIPAALMTCNAGNPDGDITNLIGNNTVTIIQT